MCRSFLCSNLLAFTAGIYSYGWLTNLSAAPRASGFNPDSPDTLVLSLTIRDHIVKTSGENGKPEDLKAYQGRMTKGPKPQEFTMLPIPGGEFVMGSPQGEKDRLPDEGPQVKVRIDPFWMGETEVTWDLYMPFMSTPSPRYKDGSKKKPLPDEEPVDAVSSPTPPYTDMTFGMGKEGFPAICMTQHAAGKFCQWLSAQTGQFYRLPTEAEWEYAARAGTTTTWSFGDDPSKLGEYAWFFENSDATSHPVGLKKPNPWGLRDIHGNLAEWVMDQYSPDFYASLKSPSPGAAVANPFNSPVTEYPRVVRGGSWDDDVRDLRSAVRRGSRDSWKAIDPQLPKSRWYLTSAQFVGMRIVRPLKLPPLQEMHDAWNLGRYPEK